jgi:hypothetical protein
MEAKSARLTGTGLTEECPKDAAQFRRDANGWRAAHRLKSVLPGSVCYLNEFQAGEEIADFEGGGFGSVRAVRTVVADAGAEVVANGAGGGFFGVGRTHGVAPLQDGAVGFEDHGENFAGAHEVGEFAEERTGFVDGVEAAGFLFGEAHGFDGDDLETSFVNAGKDFTLLSASDGIRFDDCESAFE